MTVVDAEPKILLLSQVILATVEEDNTGSDVCKWSRPTRPPSRCYGLKT